MTDEHAALYVEAQLRLAHTQAARVALSRAAHVLRTASKAIDAILALPTSPRPDGCWCGADTGLGERHLQACDDVRAALSTYREGPKP